MRPYSCARLHLTDVAFKGERRGICTSTAVTALRETTFFCGRTSGAGSGWRSCSWPPWGGRESFSLAAINLWRSEDVGKTFFSLYLNRKDVRLPVQLQRAMAAEAEAAREARAKVIAAEGEQKASRALREASEVISESPSALQLRYLQTLNTISAEKNSTIIFPGKADDLIICLILTLVPMDIISHFFAGGNAASGGGGGNKNKQN